MRRRMLSVGVLIGLCLSAQVAVAQTTTTKHTKTNVQIVLPDGHITGTYHKPSAFYILQPDALSYKSLKLEEHFIEALKKTVYEDDVF